LNMHWIAVLVLMLLTAKASAVAYSDISKLIPLIAP
jgi:hypothetical protein